MRFLTSILDKGERSASWPRLIPGEITPEGWEGTDPVCMLSRRE